MEVTNVENDGRATLPANASSGSASVEPLQRAAACPRVDNLSHHLYRVRLNDATTGHGSLDDAD
jgi:hypothetical protein